MTAAVWLCFEESTVLSDTQYLLEVNTYKTEPTPHRKWCRIPGHVHATCLTSLNCRYPSACLHSWVSQLCATGHLEFSHLKFDMGCIERLKMLTLQRLVLKKRSSTDLLQPCTVRTGYAWCNTTQDMAGIHFIVYKHVPLAPRASDGTPILRKRSPGASGAERRAPEFPRLRTWQRSSAQKTDTGRCPFGSVAQRK